MELNSAMKNKIISLAGKWMQAEIIILGKEVRLRETNTACFLLLKDSKFYIGVEKPQMYMEHESRI